MGNIFDRLKVSAFSVVTRTMGYAATWSPSQGGESLQATVLYMEPTEAVKIYQNIEFNPYKPSIEFLTSDFVGLKESVDAGELEKVAIVINGIESEFYVREIMAIVDGGKYLAILERVSA